MKTRADSFVLSYSVSCGVVRPGRLRFEDGLTLILPVIASCSMLRGQA